MNPSTLDCETGNHEGELKLMLSYITRGGKVYDLHFQWGKRVGFPWTPLTTLAQLAELSEQEIAKVIKFATMFQDVQDILDKNDASGTLFLQAIATVRFGHRWKVFNDHAREQGLSVYAINKIKSVAREWVEARY